MPSPSNGDIYWVDFDPSIGHEYQKCRPAVIVQSNPQLKKSSLITIIPLTSQIQKKHEDDILAQKNESNKLYADSLLKVHAITSFDKHRFLKKIGSMDAKIMDQIKQYLRIHFGL